MPKSQHGYGRARLKLGIFAVGTIVVFCVACLLADVPGRINSFIGSSFWGAVGAFLAFAAVHAVLHLPFDIFGGYILPRLYGRRFPSGGRFVYRLLRGAVAYAVTLTLALVALFMGGTIGGLPGVVMMGISSAILLLWARLRIASILTPLKVRTALVDSDLTLAECDDEGFTGGVIGVVHPTAILYPARWVDALSSEQLAYARLRREIAVLTGCWRRGRLLALLFILAGLTGATAVIEPARLGTSGGTIEISLWFTLWTFIGLLLLPTASRRGVIEVDSRARQSGVSDEVALATHRALDALQDNEPERAALVETIFHPIPSVRNRESFPSNPGIGGWDSARTAIYLGLAGGGLLGRSVHCNCGRPSLWAFLPLD